MLLYCVEAEWGRFSQNVNGVLFFFIVPGSFSVRRHSGFDRVVGRGYEKKESACRFRNLKALGEARGARRTIPQKQMGLVSVTTSSKCRIRINVTKYHGCDGDLSRLPPAHHLLESNYKVFVVVGIN